MPRARRFGDGCGFRLGLLSFFFFSPKELRLQKALSRVRAPSRSISSPTIKTPEKAKPLEAKKMTFQDLRRSRETEQPGAKKPDEASVTRQQPQVAVSFSRSAAPAREPVVKRHAVTLQDPVLSDAELERRCLQWLEAVRPFLVNADEQAEFLSFEVGEEMERKSPRVVK